MHNTKINKEDHQVTLIAVAKDEACYLHEWIHHHLYMGFDNIIIGINRTTDDSLKVLTKITEQYQNVSFEVVDWIDKVTKDKNPIIQQLTYSYLSQKALNEHNASHLMYLDVDEFWFSKDFTSIHSLLNKYDKINYDIISFNWLCQGGEQEAYCPPFNNVNFVYSLLVKSMITKQFFNRSDVIMGCHVPSVGSEQHKVHIDAGGRNFKARKKNKIISSQPHKECFEHYILHRMMRSEREYISTLFGGNPEGEFIKRNRHKGFEIHSLSLLDIPPAEYYESLNQFIKTCELQEILSHVRTNKIHHLENHIKEIDITILNKEYLHAYQGLTGTSFFYLFLSRMLADCKSPLVLQEIASLISSTDIEMGYKLLNKAKKINPEDIKLNLKVRNLNDSLSEQ